MPGPARSRGADNGGKTGGPYRADDRSDHGRHRQARTSRLRPTSPQYGGSAQRPGRSTAGSPTPDRGPVSASGSGGCPVERGIRRSPAGCHRRLPLARCHIGHRARRLVTDAAAAAVGGAGPASAPASGGGSTAGRPGTSGFAGVTCVSAPGPFVRVTASQQSAHASSSRTEPAMPNRRRMFLRAGGAVCLLAIASVTAYAQTPPAVPPGPLTLEQVLALAEPRSEGVAIAQ